MAYPEPLPTVGGDDDAWGPILNDAIGSIDGRLNTAETKLSGVEAGATADQTGAEIKAAYEAEADTNAYTDAEKSKLAGVAAGAEVNTVDSVNGATGVVVLDPDDLDDTSTTHKFATAAQLSKIDSVETGADVTDAANVTAAGALMDSEVTNLAAVKAFDSADYATAAQGAKADAAETNLTYGQHVVTWNGSAWRYRGANTAARPTTVAAYNDGGYVLWDTSQDVTVTTPPSLAVAGDKWWYHRDAVPESG